MSLTTTSILIQALNQIKDYALESMTVDITDKFYFETSNNALEAYERLKHNGLGEVVYTENPANSMKEHQLLKTIEARDSEILILRTELGMLRKPNPFLRESK
jgi:hypothetical protein